MTFKTGFESKKLLNEVLQLLTQPNQQPGKNLCELCSSLAKKTGYNCIVTCGCSAGSPDKAFDGNGCIFLGLSGLAFSVAFCDGSSGSPTFVSEGGLDRLGIGGGSTELNMKCKTVISTLQTYYNGEKVVYIQRRNKFMHTTFL